MLKMSMGASEETSLWLKMWSILPTTLSNRRKPMSQSWPHFLINQYTIKGDKRFLITMGNSCLEFTLEGWVNKTGLHNNRFVQYSAGISGDTSGAARVWWTA
jgi:hypothetical protein